MPRKAPNRQLLREIFKNHQVLRDFESLFEDNSDFQTQIDSLQEEIDRVETGAGLETDGTYIVPSGTNYIDSSTSIMDAVEKVDNVSNGAHVTTVTTDTNMSTETRTLLVDASSGEIDITLPNPTAFHSNSISRAVGITKTDSSVNIINILPNGSETIVNETSQELRLQGEVLNFISDGTNWWLQN